MTLAKYLSDPLRCRAAAWAPLYGGVYVTVVPLIDETSGLLASLTYRGALVAAAHFGARLPSHVEMVALDRAGFLLRPVTLPATSDMDSLAWERRHTDGIRKQLALWDGRTPLVNAGKHWIAGASSGHAKLMGWDPDGAGPLPFIQAGTGEPHNDMHHDYGTTTMLVRDTPLPPDASALALFLGGIEPSTSSSPEVA